MRVLVTGGCGFIGSQFISHFLTAFPDAAVVNLDALTYAAHPDMPSYLKTIAAERYHFVRLDIVSEQVAEVMRKYSVEAVVNFAAETHVDRSIIDASAFVRTNVMGVQNILQCARDFGNIRFVHVSTDEVYGSLEPDDEPFSELSPLSPNSPYAASKAAADLLTLASFRTYDQQVMITRCSNNYGPFQFPEKLLPLVIANALEDRAIPVYGDGKQVRDWIFVKDHCEAIAQVLIRGVAGEVYNISASQEIPNLTLISKVLDLLGKPKSLMKHVGDRPAHDRRYGLDSGKIRRELGWKPGYSFGQGLEETIRWYQDNQTWWKKLRGKDYYQYYHANYADKFYLVQKGEKEK